MTNSGDCCPANRRFATITAKVRLVVKSKSAVPFGNMFRFNLSLSRQVGDGMGQPSENVKKSLSFFSCPFDYEKSYLRRCLVHDLECRC